MPGTSRPATAIAVMASRPKMLAAHPDVNPAAAARFDLGDDLVDVAAADA